MLRRFSRNNIQSGIVTGCAIRALDPSKFVCENGAGMAGVECGRGDVDARETLDDVFVDSDFFGRVIETGAGARGIGVEEAAIVEGADLMV